MQTTEQTKLQNIILELEKRYPYFKKMDIYATVSNAYKKIHSFFTPVTDNELEAIKNIADNELKLSL
ncbi:MAG: hypothetical protein JST87_05715 [Bacteroidetes bacterium]|nr:hypothetical protein [Bacteroidota bacterium]MBS1932926.1 hypothetical protein [Bacteroidota bacterium]